VTKSSSAQRRLLDGLTPGPECGRPVALLATTYEFDPQFFESELLPAILGLGAWNDRSWAGRIALENALASLDASCVLVDQRSYRGRPRSLRLEVRPAIGPSGELLHAKVLLAVYENAVRFQVASANLTQAGYRENREVALPTTAFADTPDAAGVILRALRTMPERLAPWWSESAERVRSLAEARLSQWVPTAAGAAADILWSGGDEPVWRRFVDGWPSRDRVERISVVSPFWSHEDDTGPLTVLTRALRERGVLTADLRIDLYVEAEPAGSGVFRPRLPALGCVDPHRLGARVFVHAVDPLPREDPAHSDILKNRRLHAKVAVLHGTTGTLAYAGSGNFTRPGWGFGTRANVECGVMLRRPGPSLAEALLPPTTGTPVELSATTELPAVGKDDPVAVPTFLTDARLEVVEHCADRLELVARTEPAKVAGSFTLADGSGAALIAGDASSPNLLRIPLTSDGLKRLLLDPRLVVTWWGSAEPAEYPINVALAARAELPVVPGGGTPDERMLLAYYQGRMSLAELYPPPPDWQDEDSESFGAPALADSRVDTSRIQSYRVREFVEALQGIRDDLKAASTGTEASMRAALNGPISPVALARQVKQAAAGGDRTATAAGFQLAEIALCLQQAADVAGPPAWSGHVAVARETVESMLQTLTAEHPRELRSPTFQRYVHAILRRRS
jgi:hypothetical protein